MLQLKSLEDIRGIDAGWLKAKHLSEPNRKFRFPAK
jgi:hypothetical protein